MKRTYILVLAAVIFVFAVLTGCDLFNTVEPVTVAERIGMFEDELNKADRSNLYTHFHDDTQDKQSVADAEVFDVGPLSYDYEPYVITLPDPIPPVKDGLISFTGTFTNDNFTEDAPGTISFVMKEMEATVWYILRLTVAVDVNEDGDTEDDNEEFEIRKLF